MVVFNVGTVVVTLAGILVACAVRRLFMCGAEQSGCCSIDFIFAGALATRLLFLVVCSASNGGEMPFFVFDDQTYYQYASRAIGASNLYELGFYHVFLRTVYDAFGASSLNGRLINVLLASSAVYPIAYIEGHLSGRGCLLATRLYSFMPYMFFSSCFEIKDNIALFLYMTVYALLIAYSEHRSKTDLILAVPLLILSEEVRSTSGVLPAVIFLYSIIFSRKSLSPMSKKVGYFMVGAAVVLAAIYIFSEGTSEYLNTLDDYQTWITTQFSSSSLYNFFIVQSPEDIWRVPFSVVLYLLQPLTFLDGSGRVFADIGGILKTLDIPIVCLALRWLPRYVSKEKERSLMLVVPLVFLACVNLTNAREGIYIYPFIYIIFSMGWSRLRQAKVSVSSGASPELSMHGQEAHLLILFYLLVLLVQCCRVIQAVG